MARLNKLLTGYVILDEVIIRSSSTALGLQHDTILYPATNVEIWTGIGKTGTKLTLTTDYTISSEDTRLTAEAGAAVFTKIAVVNGTYHNITLYVNYTTVGDYAKADDVNRDFTFRNKLINGNFDFWQRGTSLLISTAGTGNAYLADRFNVEVSGTGASTTYSRQAFTIGQTDVPGNPKYYLRSLCTNGGDATNGIHRLVHSVEDVNTMAGKATMLTVWAKADAAKNLSIEISQNFGTGGSPSTEVPTFVQKFAITTAWAKYTIPITVPSITGKTIGTDGAHTSSLKVRIWMSAGSAFAARTDTLGIQTGTFDFAQVQLEEGSTATVFEQRPYQVELALCQRYYEKSMQIEDAPGTASYGAAHFSALDAGSLTRFWALSGGAFKVTKRALPTLVFYSDDGTINNISAYSAGTKLAVSAAAYTRNCINFLTAASGIALVPYIGQWTASADF